LTLIAVFLFFVSASTKFYSSLIIFTLAMAARGLHHGGVSVNPHDFAPNHTGSVFGIFNAFSGMCLRLAKNSLNMHTLNTFLFKIKISHTFSEKVNI
jgi:hypothetical protein